MDEVLQRPRTDQSAAPSCRIGIDQCFEQAEDRWSADGHQGVDALLGCDHLRWLTDFECLSFVACAVSEPVVLPPSSDQIFAASTHLVMFTQLRVHTRPGAEKCAQAWPIGWLDLAKSA